MYNAFVDFITCTKIVKFIEIMVKYCEGKNSKSNR